METKTTDIADTAVPMCNLRAGDMISFADGFPANSQVTLAEYAPVGACVAFRVGTLAGDGSTNLMPRPNWGHHRPGTFAWGEHVYMTTEDAARANNRVDLFHEIYPDLA